MVTTEQWTAHLKSTLQAIVDKSGRAATGARLKARLLEDASANGVEVPTDFMQAKFKEWLMEMQSRGHLHVLQREGEDLLVAPIDQPELLINSPERKRRPAGIRQDMFQAFTLVGDRIPWFHREQDRVDWTLDDNPPSPSHVRIPSPSFELLRRNRERFVATLDAPTQAKFGVAMAQPKALQGFSKVVRDLGLRGAWHSFRATELTEAIKVWADEHGIPWHPTWFASGAELCDEAPATETSSLRADDRRQLDKKDMRELFGLLDPEDLARVMVPLDIVAKLIGRVRR